MQTCFSTANNKFSRCRVDTRVPLDVCKVSFGYKDTDALLLNGNNPRTEVTCMAHTLLQHIHVNSEDDIKSILAVIKVSVILLCLKQQSETECNLWLSYFHRTTCKLST